MEDNDSKSDLVSEVAFAACPYERVWNPEIVPDGFAAFVADIDALLDAFYQPSTAWRPAVGLLLRRLVGPSLPAALRGHSAAKSGDATPDLSAKSDLRTTSSHERDAMLVEGSEVLVPRLSDAARRFLLEARAKAIGAYCPIHVNIFRAWLVMVQARHMARHTYAVRVYLRLADFLQHLCVRNSPAVAGDASVFAQVLAFAPGLIGMYGSRRLTVDIATFLESRMIGLWMPALAGSCSDKEREPERFMAAILNQNAMHLEFENQGLAGTPPLVCPRVDWDDVKFHLLKESPVPLDGCELEVHAKTFVQERNLRSVRARRRGMSTAGQSLLFPSSLEDPRIFELGRGLLAVPRHIRDLVPAECREEIILACVAVAELAGGRLDVSLAVQELQLPVIVTHLDALLLAAVLEIDEQQRFRRERGTGTVFLLNTKTTEQLELDRKISRACDARLEALSRKLSPTLRKLLAMADPDQGDHAMRALLEEVNFPVAAREALQSLESFSLGNQEWRVAMLCHVSPRLSSCHPVHDANDDPSGAVPGHASPPDNRTSRDGVPLRLLLPAAPEPVPTLMENPYRTGTLYHTIFQCLLDGPPMGRSSLVQEVLRRRNMAPTPATIRAVGYAVSIVVSPREGTARGDRGHKSARGNLYYITKDRRGCYHLHRREMPGDDDDLFFRPVDETTFQ